MLVVAGQPDDEVRRLSAPSSSVAVSFSYEVALLEHAGELDDAPQLDFAPPAADVRRAQRLREALGGGAELFLRLARAT